MSPTEIACRNWKELTDTVATRPRARRIATVAVNQFIFKQPVSIGDLLSFFAKVERIGRTSITVRVEVFAERHHDRPIVVRVTQAELTYVAIDESGAKRELSAE